MYEDEDVTNKFLHVIRDKRREKYGRVLYGSDGAVEVSFAILILILYFNLLLYFNFDSLFCYSSLQHFFYYTKVMFVFK